LVYDPRIAITHLVENGEMSEDDLFGVNLLLKDLKQEVIEAKFKPEPPKLVPLKRKQA
jgi:hypothetical protein